MGISGNWKNLLLSASLRAAFLHDLGKTSHQFQRLVRVGAHPPQALRHEWISLYVLLHFDELDRWLFPEGNGLGRNAATFSAIGHHLQVSVGNAFYPRDGSGDPNLNVMTGHREVGDLLSRAGTVLGLSQAAPVLSDLAIDLIDPDPLSKVRPWFLEADIWWKNASEEEQRFVALIKALVVAADLAGSALPHTGSDAPSWIREALSRVCQPDQIKNIAMRPLRRKPLRPFQLQVAETKARITLVKAGCGSGKTTAAYLWSTEKARNHKSFFCYPTTGTATEGYAGYILPDDIDAALIHSRAEIDLEELGAPDCTDDEQLRIEALAAWDVPLVVCTADTVLGVVQNNRRGLFSFPAICNGAFVFDEVHAYDDRMFGSLLRFLESFRTLPVLLMTASLPPGRINALKNLAAKLREPFAEIEGPRELEQIPRYILEKATLEDVWSKTLQVLSDGGKVLWVSNTVDRVINLSQNALERGVNPMLPYHSRYRYCDRVTKHRAVMGAFRAKGPVLALTTQVCEVSLDLSADLLVSDLAPVPALIQRLGRLNRYVTPENPGQPRTAFFLKPPMSLPYEDVDLQQTDKWLANVGPGPVSQAKLADAFLQIVGDESNENVTSAWLDGGPFSVPAPLREAGTTIPVIRGEDAQLAREDRRQRLRLAIPMPLGAVSRESGGWPRIGIARAAPAGRIEYSQEWGARWAR
jgi:CRISPR-associated endonuclease/helicase Cas3